MEKNYFIQLLRKYFTSELTTEEKEYVESYYNLFENEPDVLDQLSPAEKETLKNELKGAMESSMAENAFGAGKKKTRSGKTGLYAAAAMIAIILTAGLMYRAGVFPGRKNPTMAVIQVNEVRTVLLSDGSKVILSPGSRFSYPVSFEGKANREVALDGQAFFEITHMASVPFVVHTGKLETKVLGTAFLIRAVPGDNNISVTVNRGKVQVSEQEKVLGVLMRDEQIVFSRNDGGFVHNTVNSDKLISWTRQELRVNNLTLAEAGVLLEKEFNVKIEISDSLIGSRRFTATFPESETLDQALKIICEFNGAVYRYDNDESVVIETKPNKK
jgi:ferric-dicitrate binding protein FerR (iron transport regulator)